MKILLDECVSKRLKPLLQGYEVYTVTEMRWNGIKNGKLMSLCIDNNFDVLLTIDKSLMYQQNLNQYKLTVAVLDSLTSKVEELAMFIPSFIEQTKDFEKHKAYLISK